MPNLLTNILERKPLDRRIGYSKGTHTIKSLNYVDASNTRKRKFNQYL